MSAPEVCGLALAGGRSARMGRDKAAMVYRGKAQVDALRELLGAVCGRVFLSCRPDQTGLSGELLPDRYDNIGPLAGILTALDARPDAAWLVCAIDLPFLDRATLDALVAGRDPARMATAFRGRVDGKPEPLCAIYEPAIRARLHEAVRAGLTCPRKILMRSDIRLLDLPHPLALENANHPDEAARAWGAPPGGVALDTEPAGVKRECDACPPGSRTVRVRLYAVLRETVGHPEIALQTAAHTARGVFEDLRGRYGIAWTADQFRVAVNDSFCPWDTPVTGADVVHVIPPVAGG